MIWQDVYDEWHEAYEKNEAIISGDDFFSLAAVVCGEASPLGCWPVDMGAIRAVASGVYTPHPTAAEYHALMRHGDPIAAARWVLGIEQESELEEILADLLPAMGVNRDDIADIQFTPSDPGVREPSGQWEGGHAASVRIAWEGWIYYAEHGAQSRRGDGVIEPALSRFPDHVSDRSIAATARFEYWSDGQWS
jgi:hypothetical protein